MNPTEAAQLLLHAAAFDNRKPSLIAAQAWAIALQDVPLDRDTLAAVARYYGTPGDDPDEKRWLHPHHVRYHRNEIRRERITAANLIYDGDPDESPMQSVVSLRQLVQAAGDGVLPPRTVRAALEPAQPRDEQPVGRAKAILAAVGEHIPRRRDGAVNVFSVPCPICHARAGRPCTSPSNPSKRRADPHPARLDDARRAAVGQPPVDRSEVEREIQRRKAAAAAVLAALPAGTVVEPDDGFAGEAS